MDKLLEKVRKVTFLERKKLAEEGIYLLSMDPKREEEIMFKVFSLIFKESDLDAIKCFKDEIELFSAIVNKTFEIKEADAKN